MEAIKIYTTFFYTGDLSGVDKFDPLITGDNGVSINDVITKPVIVEIIQYNAPNNL